MKYAIRTLEMEKNSQLLGLAQEESKMEFQAIGTGLDSKKRAEFSMYQKKVRDVFMERIKEIDAALTLLEKQR